MYRSLKLQLNQIKAIDHKNKDFEYRIIVLKPGETPEDYPMTDEEREFGNAVFFSENDLKLL